MLAGMVDLDSTQQNPGHQFISSCNAFLQDGSPFAELCDCQEKGRQVQARHLGCRVAASYRSGAHPHGAADIQDVFHRARFVLLLEILHQKRTMYLAAWLGVVLMLNHYTSHACDIYTTLYIHSIYIYYIYYIHTIVPTQRLPAGAGHQRIPGQLMGTNQV